MVQQNPAEVSDRAGGVRSRDEAAQRAGHRREEKIRMALYLISVLDTGTDTGTPAEMAAIDAFNEQLVADGSWVFAGGLAAPDTATVIDGRRGEVVFTDGPYLESKEHIAGFWVIRAPHLDAALRIAAQGSKHCNRRVELRPFLDK
jgi:hypothetical protein